jgi:hypothetical protein
MGSRFFTRYGRLIKMGFLLTCSGFILYKPIEWLFVDPAEKYKDGIFIIIIFLL